MEVIRRGNYDQVRCEHCGTELRFNKNDLEWYHGEPDYYYVVCPICGKWVWVEQNETTTRMYKEAHGR